MTEPQTQTVEQFATNPTFHLNMGRFCSLLQSALAREVAESQVGYHKGRPEHLLSSVASALSVFAPELAIAYLFRKEAEGQGGAFEWPSRYKIRSFVDFCLIINGGYAASLEITEPCGTFEGPLKRDSWMLSQSVPDVPSVSRSWSLALQDETTTEVHAQFVRYTLQNHGAVGVCIVSNPIPIDRITKAASQYDGHRYENLRVVISNGVMARCDVCDQQVAASELFSIRSGPITVCRKCRMQATTIIRQ